ncbi:hypothetical protein [Ochrobactrum quorumnocens]|jgi:hypothetical protein|uniref:hypothetical protein n=1 Tax=Ochrobactrum quorumnocens TaxID=271865 RepID=UPI001FD36257|nr:hypothetical protein [[Ochrobactrum] quorumnocens]
MRNDFHIACGAGFLSNQDGKGEGLELPAHVCRRQFVEVGNEGSVLRRHLAEGNHTAVAKPGREPEIRRFLSKFRQLGGHFHYWVSGRIPDDRVCRNFYDSLLDIHPVKSRIDEKDDESDGGDRDRQKLEDQLPGDEARLQ